MALTAHTAPLPLSPPVPIASLDPPETNLPERWQGTYATTAPPAPRLDRRELSPPNLSQTFRHSGWDPLRIRVYRALQRTGQPVSRIRNFSECGSQAYVLHSTTDPEIYRVAGSSCHDRFCQPCANERSRAIALNVISHLGTTKCRFLTLTIRTGAEPLADCLSRLYAAFSALQRTSLWRTRVSGGVSFVEVKWNPEPGRWHPHIHAIITGKFIPHADLKETWQRVTGDSNVVHITRCGNSDQVSGYCTKYASKPLNGTFANDYDRLDEAIVALKGHRLCTTFGGWRKVLLVDHPDEEAWENLGPLETWIVRAANGDENARFVLNRIHATKAALAIAAYDHHERPPPPPPETPRAQQTFWDMVKPRINP